MRTIFGTLLLVGIGVGVGILLAPDKGANVRKKLMKRGAQYQKNFRDLVETGKEELDRITDDLVSLAAKEKKRARKFMNI